MGRVLLLLAGVLVLGAGAAVASWLHEQRRFVDEAVSGYRAGLAAHHDAFLRDQERLARLPLLAARRGGDAGPVIGPRIRWGLATPGGLRLKQAEGASPDFDAVQRLQDGLAAPPERWRGLDFGWMGRLRDMGTWDLGRGGMPDDLASFMEPAPNGADLATWAELRIARGIEEGEVGPALAEVEELARLSFTTERWELHRVGLGLLELVHRVRETVPGAAGYTPAVGREDLEIMRRAGAAALGFARLETPARYDADLDRFALGKCAAIHDGVRFALGVRPVLHGAWSAAYARVDRLLAAHPECPLRALRARWALPPGAVAPARFSVLEPMARRWPAPPRLLDTVRWIPAVRRAGAEALLAMGAQDRFRGYEAAGPAR